MAYKEYMKQFREENKEKIKEKNKEWYETNKEKQKEWHKKWYETNKNRIKEKDKQYREANKEKKKEYLKQYSKTENGKKSNTIRRWKNRGLTDTDIDYIYDLYKNTTNCWVCNHDFSKNCKCMDHEHETGMFRQIICKKCNLHDNWKNYSEIV